MPGILITAGMDLRISDLRIPLDGSPPPSVTVTVRMDTWQHWLLVACDNVTLASAAEARLREAFTTADDVVKGAALEEEFRSAMTAVCACSFALDALYSTVAARFGHHPTGRCGVCNEPRGTRK